MGGTVKDLVIDARRLLCPMPVIRLQQAIANAPSGTVCELVCTDPGALEDVPAWCRIHGHSVIMTEELGSEIMITVKVE